jgi:hypothetical protein
MARTTKQIGNWSWAQRSLDGIGNLKPQLEQTQPTAQATPTPEPQPSAQSSNGTQQETGK